MKQEKEKYLKELMQKYNLYNQRELHDVINYDEYNKLIKLELESARGV